MSNERGPVRQEGASSEGQRIRSIPLLTFPCIQIEDRPTCILLHRLAAFIDIMWYVGLGRREEKGHVLGELTLRVAMGSQQQMARCPAATDSEAVAANFLASLLSCHRCIAVVDINHAIAKRMSLINLVQHRCGVRSLSIREDLHHKENGINAVLNVLNPFDEHMISLLEEYHNYSVRRPTLAVPPKPNGWPTLTTLDVATLELSGLCTRKFATLTRDNRTLTYLIISACLLLYGCINVSDGFCKCLAQEDSVLKKLVDL